MEAIKSLAEHVDEQHAQTRDELRSEIGSLHSEMTHGRDSLKKELSDFRFSTEEGFNSVEHVFREEDKKIDRLTEKMLIKKVISEKDTKEVLGLGPFPLQSPAADQTNA